MKKIGILLTNLGTPDSHSRLDLKKYLKEFLTDTRVVNPKNKLLWYLVLHLIVLNTRPQKSAKNYAKIWNSFGKGSPLLNITKLQLNSVRKSLPDNENLEFAIGMRYGNPSIVSSLQKLKAKNCDKIIILPLYPQHSGATTLSTLDVVNATINTWKNPPEIVFIKQYYQNSLYIKALANSVIDFQKEHGKPDKLIMSYHGMPQRYIDNGDDYLKQCLTTSKLLADKLNLNKNKYQVSFQSVFGKEKWIEPYTDLTIKTLARQDIKHIQVICPGFSADCLETLEEIDNENRKYFLEAGGETFGYIPALNYKDDHIRALCNIINDNI